jgi:uncharacterized membrane protein
MTSWQAIRNSFIAGFILILPLVITLYILQLLAGFALQFIDPVAQGTELERYTANVELVARILAVGLIIVSITILGYIAQTRTGQRLFGTFGRMVDVVPLVSTIYSTVRQMAASFSSTETAYDSLVLVEYPRKGVYAIGLVMNESPSAINEVAGSKAYNVFLPSSPSPASGRLIVVPEDQLCEVDLTVRQGLRLIMTTGAGSEEEDLELPPEVEDNIIEDDANESTFHEGTKS